MDHAEVDRAHYLVAVTVDDMRLIVVYCYEQTLIVAQHWKAIDYYLDTGDANPLRRFAELDLSGNRLCVDPAAIDALVRDGRYLRAGDRATQL